MVRAHVIIYRLVTAEVGVQYPDSPYGTCGEQSIAKISSLSFYPTNAQLDCSKRMS